MIAEMGSGRRRSPSFIGFLVGLATGAVFFVAGFAGGHGPRIGRITGNPGWIVGLEVAAGLALVAGVVAVIRANRRVPGASPIFGYLAGWSAAIALTIALAVFLDARSDLARFGLTVEGQEDPRAGSNAALTRRSHNTLALVDAFLSFIGTFAVSFVVLALTATVLRAIVNGVIRLLRVIGILPPETIADF